MRSSVIYFGIKNFSLHRNGELAGFLPVILNYTRFNSDDKIGLETTWFYGVMVSTLDSESSDPSSNLGRT